MLAYNLNKCLEKAEILGSLYSGIMVEMWLPVQVNGNECLCVRHTMTGTVSQ